MLRVVSGLCELKRFAIVLAAISWQTIVFGWRGWRLRGRLLGRLLQRFVHEEESLCHDFGYGHGSTIFIGVLAIAYAPLYAQLHTLAHPLLCPLGQMVRCHDTVPVRLLLHLSAVLAHKRFVASGEGEGGYGEVVGEISDFAISAYMSDKNDFVV